MSGNYPLDVAPAASEIASQIASQTLTFRSAAPLVQHPSGTTLPLPLSVTLDSGTAREIILPADLPLPRMLSIDQRGDAEITVQYDFAAGQKLWTETVATSLDADRDLQLVLDSRPRRIVIQRTAGTDTTSVVTLS